MKKDHSNFNFQSAVIDYRKKTYWRNGDEAETTTIRFRATDRVVQKTFLLDHKLKTLFQFGDKNGFKNCIYKLITVIPNKLVISVNAIYLLSINNYCFFSDTF